MNIGGFNTNERIMVVAEIGNNHEGNVDLAEDMVRLAGEAGADAVKFQVFRTEDYVSPNNPQRFDMLKSFELKPGDIHRLKDAADKAGVLFIATPFDLHSAKVLSEVVTAFKISSGDNTFYPLLESVAGYGKPVIMSGGLSDVNQLRYSLSLMQMRWLEMGMNVDAAVLHCVTSYPVPPEEANLGAITQLRNELGCTVGYSDHTLGIDACVLAAAMGARILEKHFTLDKNFSEFRDHQLSADPDELAALVQRVRQAETLMGSGQKVLQDCEKPLLAQVRRNAAAAADLMAGTVLRPEHITWIRSSGGVAPGREEILLGRTLTADVTRGQVLMPDQTR